MKKDLNKNLILAAVVLVAIVVIIVVGIRFCIKDKNKGGEETSAAQTESESQTASESSSEETTGADETDAAQMTSGAEETKEAASEGAGAAEGESNPAGTNSGAVVFIPDPVVPETTAPATTQPSVTKPTIPYDMGDGILLTKFAGYNGVFLEDGSDRDIANVAAIAVQNPTGINIEYGDVTIVQGGQTYEFTYSDLPAGGRIVVMEKNAKGYADGELESVDQIYASIDSFPMTADQVTVVENADSTLTVTNVSGHDIPCVRVFYKYRMAENTFVGGITYTAKLTALGAGQSQTINPSHYIYGSSQVMMVRTFETAD